MTIWSTNRVERTVLGIVHNITAATRLFDVVDLLAVDQRIQVEFTITGSSAFTEGTEEFLRSAGIMPVPWNVAVERKFDLAISASHGGELENISAPLISVPHGVGYNKYLRSEIRDPRSENREPVFGLAGEWLLHNGKPIATTLVLSHHEQLTRLAAACEPAAGTALVAGDPCYDRMLASTPLRGSYRRALGVPDDRRLIVISSTWGEGSLYREHPGLVRRIAAALPIDEYRITVALHPNIWQRHSTWQVRKWYRGAEQAGVHVLPAKDGWRAALVAADLVVGDHGSVTFYGAGLGRPALLATAPHHTVAPDSAIGRFLRTAPRLDPHGDLRTQLDAAITTPPDLTAVTALISDAPGDAMTRLRAECYRLLDLPEPPTIPDTAPVPAPAPPERVEPDAQLVRVDPGDITTITRYPAELGPGTTALPPGSHLAVAVTEPRRRLLELADIVVLDHPADAPAALAALPGSLLATAPLSGTGWCVRHTDGTELHLHGIGRTGASLVHAWLTAGHPMTSFPATMSVRMGHRELTVSRCTSDRNPPSW